MTNSAGNRGRSLIVVLFVYLFAILAGGLAFGPALSWLQALGRPWLSGLEPLAAAFVSDLVATVVVFSASAVANNSSVYDPYWSVAPPVLGLSFAGLGLLDPGGLAQSWRVVLALGLVCVWGYRLTHSFFRGWVGLSHEDFRYRDLRAKTGPWYWLVSLLGIHAFPTVLTFLGSISLFAVARGRAPFGVFDVLGVVVGAGAITIEALADRQLHDFRRSRPAPGAILESGLWHYSRHPNYFGETSFWWGLWLLALAASPDMWWAVLGPLSITLLFVFVSIPMIDRRMLARRPGYRAHMDRVSALVPWPPRT